jgi:hypothetical protein
MEKENTLPSHEIISEKNISLTNMLILLSTNKGILKTREALIQTNISISQMKIALQQVQTVFAITSTFNVHHSNCTISIEHEDYLTSDPTVPPTILFDRDHENYQKYPKFDLTSSTTINHKNDTPTSDSKTRWPTILPNHLAFSAINNVNKTTTSSPSLSSLDQFQPYHPSKAYIVRLDPQIPIPTQATSNLAVFTFLSISVSAHQKTFTLAFRLEVVWREISGFKSTGVLLIRIIRVKSVYYYIIYQQHQFLSKKENVSDKLSLKLTLLHLKLKKYNNCNLHNALLVDTAVQEAFIIL